MQLSADGEKIKRWREDRAWSQEHLAQVAGIGVRTIQRVENGESASRESVMALAAAFEVDVLAVTVDAKSEATKLFNEEQTKRISALRLSFFIHLASYLFGMLVFGAISISADRYVMLWPAIWWTVGVAGHGLTVVIVELVHRFQTLD